jgi:hypothetical protein
MEDLITEQSIIYYIKTHNTIDLEGGIMYMLSSGSIFDELKRDNCGWFILCEEELITKCN